MHSTHVTRLINKVVRVLEKGRTSNVYARDSKGFICDPNSPEASCWCLTAAISIIDGSGARAFGTANYNNLANLLTEFTGQNLVFWNDNTKDDSEIILGLLMARIAYREGLISI